LGSFGHILEDEDREERGDGDLCNDEGAKANDDKKPLVERASTLTKATKDLMVMLLPCFLSVRKHSQVMLTKQR
jgi:hypothetical protein